MFGDCKPADFGDFGVSFVATVAGRHTQGGVAPVLPFGVSDNFCHKTDKRRLSFVFFIGLQELTRGVSISNLGPTHPQHPSLLRGGPPP